MQHIVLTEEDMVQFGKRLSTYLFPGSFVALWGGLGAGKTTLSRGIGLGLGIDDIASPTFTIVQEHDTIPSLFHFDVYRLSSPEELEDIGFDEYMNRNGIIVMEWPEHVLAALPQERLDIHISGFGDSARQVSCTATGIRYQSLVQQLSEEV